MFTSLFYFGGLQLIRCSAVFTGLCVTSFKLREYREHRMQANCPLNSRVPPHSPFCRISFTRHRISPHCCSAKGSDSDSDSDWQADQVDPSDMDSGVDDGSSSNSSSFDSGGDGGQAEEAAAPEAPAKRGPANVAAAASTPKKKARGAETAKTTRAVGVKPAVPNNRWLI